MISIKSQREIELMKIAGSIVGECHLMLEKHLKAGITTLELDALAYNFIISKNATPSFLNYDGFPNSICISINDEVVHGIPSKRKLKNKDIVSIDIGVCYKGYHGDSAWTYAIGDISIENKNLMEYTKNALFAGLEQIKPGNRISDISNAIANYATSHNLGIVEELVGHGIGNNLHEEPNIPNFKTDKKGPLLKENMVIAVEPMLNFGKADIVLADDDWTILTMDGSISAHFEHTVLVTKDGYKILTKR